MKGKTQQLIGAMTAAMVAAAVLAGGAQAQRPDNRAGMIGVGSTSAVAVPDAFERAVNAATVAVPDAFERALNNSLAATSVRPDDLGTVRGPGVVGIGDQRTATSAASRDGFEWGDAAVGAGAAIAFLILGGAFLLTTRQRERVITP